mgnify:CR=1 FL=1
MSSSCECHNIDWCSPLKNGGFTLYNFTNGERHLQCQNHQTFGMPCQDKVNSRIMEWDDSERICKYRIGYQSLSPEDLYWFLIFGPDGDVYDSRFDENSPDYYLEHYDSAKELFRSEGEDVDAPELQLKPIVEEGIPPTPDTIQ